MTTGIELDGYEARNLLEALKVAQDTGDWYAQVREKLRALLERDDLPNRVEHPNVPADRQRNPYRSE